MDKKKRTLVLLTVVVLIYVAIAIRFFTMNSEGSDTGVYNTSDTFFIPKKWKAADTFIIENDYRDPFLGTIKKRTNKKVSTGKKRNQKKDTIVFPKITYKGIVSDIGAQTQVYAIEVRNQEYIVKKGMVVDEITIRSGSPQELQVVFKKINKTIKLADR